MVRSDHLATSRHAPASHLDSESAPEAVAPFAAIEQHLDTLRKLRERWLAEYPSIRSADPERARHHAEAIADLQHVIDYREQALAVLVLFTQPEPALVVVVGRPVRVPSTRSRAGTRHGSSSEH